jgi:two-component system NarL family sensor kinase
LVLREVARILADDLSADGCLVYEMEAGGDLVVVAGWPRSELDGAPLRLPGGVGITARVASDVVTVVLADDAPRHEGHRRLLGLADGERVSRLCVPARLPGGGCAGVLALHAEPRRQFSSLEVGTAQEVADIIGLRLGYRAATATTARHLKAWEELVVGTVAAQEAERRRVAGDLHDGVSQALAGLAFHLDAAHVALADGDLAFVTDQVARARLLADLAYGEARSAISGLHSPVLEDLGLAAALESLARTTPELTVEVEVDDLDLPVHVRTCLYRIAQEALSNAARHACATRASVTLARHGPVVALRVVDDGTGFDVDTARSRAPGSASGYGLGGMAERAHLAGGHLGVAAEPGGGTTVEVTVPLRPGSDVP